MNFWKNSRKSSRFARNHSYDILLPSTIFCDRSLSFLEALVEHLRDARGLSYHEIAELTNRDERNIWTLYHRAADKRTVASPKVKIVSNVFIPLSVVKDRSLSILEVVVKYLAEKTPLTNHQIALLVNRSDKTIWTVRNRIKKKWKTS